MVHLHLHTVFSLLDGACKPKAVAAKAKELGQTALAITDHGVMYGVVEFYQACKEAGIKPILGVELYTADNLREKDQAMGHITLLAKNNDGYRNLVALESIAATDGFYYKPRCDLKLLERYHEGIICLSGCVSGDLCKLLLADKYDEAKELAMKYRAIFGDDYYIELQYHGLEDQRKTLPLLIHLAKELGIKMVATNDVHYIRKTDALAQRVLMCISMKRLVSDETALGYGAPKEFYLKSHDEMMEIFKDIAPEAVLETDIIAEQCNVELDFGNYKLPAFPTPAPWKDNVSYLNALCDAGLKKRYGTEAASHKEQLDYELTTIHQMGFTDYMLIVSDFIRYAKQNGIGVGPGRGSAAGSIVAYCLGITNLDPEKYGLKFERFLNPERITMPDIDVDFAPSGREDVVAYAAQKYGHDHVAKIITFGSLAAKSAIRDVGKALGMTVSQTSKLTALIPLNATLKEAYNASPVLREMCSEDENVRRVFCIAQQLEGTPRNTGVHAAGVVIAPNPVSEYIPVCRNPNGDLLLSQFAMGDVEKTGMLKVDFLGLATLDIISETETLINAKWPENEHFHVWSQALNDTQVYKMLSDGDSKGVFQLESDGIRKVLRELKPTCFEDIISVVALYRPGPMDAIPKFIEGKNNPSSITYAHPLLEPILSTTYGQIVFQEQVMEIVRNCAGYSYGRSDLVRRAMSKKKPEVLAAEKNTFINGCVKEDGTVEVDGCLRRGIPLEVAEQLWSEMESFASYAFNKAHAAAYADLAYRTAFLKCYFPQEFMSASMTNAVDKPAKLLSFIDDCRHVGIPVLPPDINKSLDVFSPEGDGIRFGLMAVKDAGKSTVQAIVSERGEAPFQNLVDLLERVPAACDKGTVTALIKSGSLDSFAQNRAQMLQALPGILKRASKAKKDVLKEQITMEDSFFTSEEDNTRRAYSIGTIDWPDIPDLPQEEKLEQEMAAISLYVSGHPMAAYADAAAKKATHRIADLTERDGDEENSPHIIPSGTEVRVAGVITQVRQITTKKDKRSMCSLVISDEGGQMEATCFPKAYDAYGQRLKKGEPIILFGNVKDEDSFGRKLILNSVDFLRPASSD